MNKIIEDKNIWEDFVLGSNYNVSFFHSWNWGEFEKSLGKEVVRYGFYHNDRLVGVAQIVFVNAKRGRFMHVRNGPIFDWENIELAQDVIKTLKKIAKDKNVDFVRISPLIKYSPQDEKKLSKLGFVKNQTHDVDAEITWVLDLEQPEEQILSGMRKNTRYSIRKAEKDEVKIVKSTDIKDLKAFYEVYEDTVKRQQWHAYNYDYLAKEFEIFNKDNQIKIYLAEYNGKIIAASLFIYYGKEVYYHHSGSLTEYRKIPASYLIQWESISDAKKLDYKTYNFFGIAREDDVDHPWYGLTFFKKGFGGYERRSIHAHDLPIRKKYWLTYYYEMFEKKRRGY